MFIPRVIHLHEAVLTLGFMGTKHLKCKPNSIITYNVKQGLNFFKKFFFLKPLKRFKSRINKPITKR